MFSSTFFIAGEKLQEPLEAFVHQYQQRSHTSVYADGFIILYEEYSFLGGNDLVVCIRVDSSEAANGRMTIEFIAGGSNSTLIDFNDGFGSESRRAQQFYDSLAVFCRDHNFTIKKLEK